MGGSGGVQLTWTDNSAVPTNDTFIFDDANGFGSNLITSITATGPTAANVGSAGSTRVWVYDDDSDFIGQLDTGTFGRKYPTRTLNESSSTDINISFQSINTLNTLLRAHLPNFNVERPGTGTDGWLTIFAPIDQAFDDLATDIVDFVTWNTPVAQSILTNHVVKDATETFTSPVWSEDVAAGVPSVETLGADNLTITTNVVSDTSGLYVTIESNAAVVDTTQPKIVQPDLYYSNAVVHVIDGVLLSDAQVNDVTAILGRTSLAALVADPSTLLTLATTTQAGSFLTELESTTQQTLFMPTDEAFERDLTEEQSAYLQNATNSDALLTVLRAHLFDEAYFAGLTTEVNLLTDGNDAETLSCTGLECTFGDVSYELSSEQYSQYGVGYTIDKVIIPDGLPADFPSSASSLTVGLDMSLAAAVLALVF